MKRKQAQPSIESGDSKPARLVLNLRTKLLLLLAIFYIPMALLMAFFLQSEYFRRREQLLEQSLQNAVLAVQMVSVWIDSHMRVIHLVAPLVPVEIGGQSLWVLVVREYLRVGLEIEEFLLAGRDGNLVAAIPPIRTYLPPEMAAVLRAASQEETDRISDGFYSEELGRVAILMATPLAGDTGVDGAMGVLVNPSALLVRLLQVPLPPGSVIKLVDTQGMVLVRTMEPYQWMGKQIEAPHTDRALAGEQGTLVAKGQDGVMRLYAYVSMPQYDWGLVVGVPTPVLMGPLRRDILSLGLVLLLVLVVITLVGLRLSHSIVAAISTIRDAAEQIGRGRLDVRVPHQGEDELAGLAKDINLMVQRLEELETLRTEFVSTIIHDMRTPLTTIRSMIDFALQSKAGIGDPKALRGLEAAKRQSAQLQRIMDNMLDVSRIQSGGVSLSMDQFSLEEVLEGPVAIAQDAAAARGLSFRTEVAADLPMLYGDKTRLSQVVLNLLDNAVKYTSEGGIVLAASRQGDCLAISISDTGRGLAEKDLDLIFGRFYRSRGTQNQERPPGIGLGLYLVRRLVRMHGGRIEVSSPGPGKGSTFTVLLLIAKEG